MFLFFLLLVVLLTITDTAITLLSLNLNLAYELNPLYAMSPEAFFFAKGIGVAIIAIVAYELKNRNPSLAETGLTLCAAILTVINAWNLANVVFSLAVGV